MNKKKILHIITGLNTGGAEMMLYKLCAYKSKNINYHVISLTTNGQIGEKIRKLGIEVETVGLSKNPLSFFKLTTLFYRIKKINPDIVQTWLYHADLIGGILAYLNNKTVYWNIRQSKVNLKLNKWHTVFSVRMCALLSFIPKKIISCSQSGIKEHIKLGYPKGKMLFIPNGFETDIFRPMEKRDKIILHVGRYAPLKDHKTFINLAKELHKELPDYEFHMYGEGINTNNAKLNVHNLSYIKFMGRCSKMQNIYPTAKLLVSTSLSEGFSNTIGEAMCCGTPVIATDVGDSRFIIDNDEYVTGTGNIQHIKEKVINTLKKENDYIKIREKISTRFDIKNIVKIYEKEYLEKDFSQNRISHSVFKKIS